MTFHHKGTNWLSRSVENSSRLDTIFRKRANSPHLNPQHSVLIRHKNDLAYHMFLLRKKQRDLERRLSDHSTFLKDSLDKFDFHKQDACRKRNKRKKMVFKCSTCNETMWNKLPEIKATAQANLKESMKHRRRTCETPESD